MAAILDVQANGSLTKSGKKKYVELKGVPTGDREANERDFHRREIRE